MSFLISIGNNNFRLIKQEPEFDPTYGWVFRETYEGTEDSVKAGMTAFAFSGFKSRAYQLEGPVWRADFARVPTSVESGLPEITDQFELDTEFVQENLYNSPKLINTFGGDSGLFAAKKVIEESIDAKDNLDGFIQRWRDAFLGASPSSEAETLFILRNRGDQAVEVERTILRRVRTLPIDSAQRATIDAVPKVYTTNGLINNFQIPAFIADRLPDDPPYSPSGTTWAWKKRRDTSQFIPQLNKFQETKDWVFASWATLQYDLITT